MHKSKAATHKSLAIDILPATNNNNNKSNEAATLSLGITRAPFSSFFPLLFYSFFILSYLINREHSFDTATEKNSLKTTTEKTTHTHNSASKITN